MRKMQKPLLILIIAFSLVISRTVYAVGEETDEHLVPPEIAHCISVKNNAEFKTIIMSNDNGNYELDCNPKAAGCITPIPGTNYLIFNKNTRWRMSGAKNVIDLNFIQDWTVTYNSGENIGLIPEHQAAPFDLGIFILHSWTAKH